MLTGICDSCGDATDTLVGVHRIYLVPEPTATDAGTGPATGPVIGPELSPVGGEVRSVGAEPGRRPEVMAEIEQWCFPCRTHYPHEVLDVDG